MAITLRQEEKVEVFSAALEGMAKEYNPYTIVISCNTLSVIYPKTPFAKETNINVLGIVNFGVDLIYQHLSADNHSITILLETPTTINSGTHKNKLIERGIDPDRIIEQPCFICWNRKFR